jgi:hypothetical protein
MVLTSHDRLGSTGHKIGESDELPQRAEHAGNAVHTAQSRVDRYIGHCEPYATSHDALDRDEPMQEGTRNVARAVANAVVGLRSGRLQAVQPALSRPRPK